MLDVHVYDKADTPPSILRGAAEVLATILRGSKIELRWMVEPPNSPEANIKVVQVFPSRRDGQGEAGCSARRDIALAIRSRIVARESGVLGEANPFAPEGINAVVYSNRVADAAKKHGVPVEVVLGHAVAHEIGHVLLRTDAHSSSFLMTNEWAADHFRFMRKVPASMFFTEVQSRRIRASIAGEGCSQIGPVSSSGSGRALRPIGRVLATQASAGNGSCTSAMAGTIRSTYLDASRPNAISIQEKPRVLESLPPDGEVTDLNASQRRKLAALKPVLRSEARDGVYEVMVFSVPQAWTGLYSRAVLLVSLPALELLTAEELQALAAHEIGHEYHWAERQAAFARRDAKRLRELELAADAIAVHTLVRLGLRPAPLLSALEKMFWHNRERFGVAANEDLYPSLKERRQAIQCASATFEQN